MRTHRTLWAVAMALMVALFVAACGSSKDDDSGGSSQSASGKDCGKVVLNEQAFQKLAFDAQERIVIATTQGFVRIDSSGTVSGYPFDGSPTNRKGAWIYS